MERQVRFGIERYGGPSASSTPGEDDIFVIIRISFAGNPYPPLVFSGARNKNLLHNVLLDEARKEFRKERQAKIAEQVTQSEKEQKKMNDDKRSDENASKAAQEVSESEQLLKSVSADIEESSTAKSKSKSDEEFVTILV